MGWLIVLFRKFVGIGLAIAARLVLGILRAFVNPRGATVVEEVDAEAVIDLRHRVLRAGRPRQTAHFDADAEPTTRHWRLARNGHTVAVVSVMAAPFPGSEGPGYQLRGMAVDPEQRGQGLGSQLLQAVQADYDALWCNARDNAVAFYAHHDWRIVGEPFDIAPIGLHSRMVWRRATGGAEPT